MEIAVMIEGQDGVNWERWQRIAQIAEDSGFAGLYRSDHFTNAEPPNKDSLDLWVSFTWLASHTRRIEFGSLVSPVSFRDPVMTARTAMQVNALSMSAGQPRGRLRLGLGAGWNEREHHMFGYDLLSLPQRFARFDEALQVITRLMYNSPQPVSFQGQFYQLDQAMLLPPSPKPGEPPIVIGGNGAKYTLPLVARYAVEWNSVGLPLERFTPLNARLDQLLREAGRAPAEVRRTMMTGVLFGSDERALQTKLAGRSAQTLRERGLVYGTAEQIAEQLRQLEAAGLQRVMLGWGNLDDLEGLEAFGQAMKMKDGVMGI